MAMSMGNRIKDYREARGLSQNDIAEALKVSRPTYNAIETGKSEITLSKLHMIASFLNIPLEKLLFNTEDSSPGEKRIKKYKQVILNCLKFGSDDHDHKITKTKLAKLVYLSDFVRYYYTNSPMTGVSYRRIQRGPVADAYFRVIDELFEDGAIVIEQSGAAMMISANETAPRTLLDDEEVGLIEKISESWKNKSTQEIVDFTHKQYPWKSTQPGEIISYELIKKEANDNLY